MALGPGKGCVVRLERKETKMDGMPLKARHTLSPEIARLRRRAPPGRPPGTRFLRRPGGLRSRSGTNFSSPLDLRRLCLPGGAAGRLLHLQGRHRIGHRGARPGRRRSAPSTMSAAIAARASARPSRAMPIAWSAPITAGPTSSTAQLVLDTSKRVRRRSRRLLAPARGHRERRRAAVHLPRRLEPPDFSQALATIRHKMKPHAIERAKIAHRSTTS